MSKNHEILKQKLLDASVGDTWAEAQLEWVVTDFWEAPGGSCDCGHTPITDHLCIRNHLTEESLIVGNVCVKKFFNWKDYDKIFKGIKKIRKDPSVGTPGILLKIPLVRAALDNYKIKFLYDRQLTRNLTEKQAAFRVRCHNMILKAWDRHSLKLISHY